MKRLFLGLIYCLMESVIDCSACLRKEYYKKRYGNEWENKLKEVLRGNLESQLNMLTAYFWLMTSANLMIITSCLIDYYVLKNSNDGLSAALGFVVTLGILTPYYLWRRKNYDALIAKHDYLENIPHYSKVKKIAVFLGFLLYGITPLISLAIFAPLTSK